MDDGVIKFSIDWKEGSVSDFEQFSDLMHWRDVMFDMQLIGFDKQHDVGFGNISQKLPDSKSFAISGTQTGHIPKLGPEHYTTVEFYDIDNNTLSCVGPVNASSESLTHAAIYEADSNIQSIIHIHHDKHWEALKFKVPTTDESVPYGTPEMAYEIKRLFSDGLVQAGDIITMAGHQGGLITFGKNLEEAAQPYLELFA